VADLAISELGRTGLKVTKLGYGAMELRGPGAMFGRDLDVAAGGAVLNAVLDAGINLISPTGARSTSWPASAAAP